MEKRWVLSLQLGVRKCDTLENLTFLTTPDLKCKAAPHAHANNTISQFTRFLQPPLVLLLKTHGKGNRPLVLCPMPRQMHEPRELYWQCWSSKGESVVLLLHRSC